jgi:protein arginine kinase
MDNLSVLDRQLLVEQHLISRELSTATKGAGAYISKDKQCSVMINEEDHLRIQVIGGGFDLKKLWKTLNALDSALENHLDFSFSAQLGYLTACPTNLGTGMRASVMMHLPGLVIAGHMEQVIRAVNHMGIAVRGLFGEGSEASGSIFQISNQQTMGSTEEEILDRLEKVLQMIIEQELQARYRLLETKREKLLDKIGRAYGILKNGYFVSTEEGMHLLSLMRLASDFSFLPSNSRTTIDQLMMDIQPAHMQKRMGTESNDSDYRDVFRSTLLRREFESFAPLSFDHLPRN